MSEGNNILLCLGKPSPQKGEDTEPPSKAHSSALRKGSAKIWMEWSAFGEYCDILNFGSTTPHRIYPLYIFAIETLVMCIVYREPKDLWDKRVFLLLSDILIHDLFTKLPKQGVILFWMLA